MRGVTKQQIEQAKQMDLLTYMMTYEPQELVRVGTITERAPTTVCVSAITGCGTGVAGTSAAKPR